MPLANERFLGRAAFTMSKPYFLEAEPPGATKGEALLRLADRIGIVPERTVAFGDSLNDKSLLAFTPNSVAMGQRHPRAAPRRPTSAAPTRRTAWPASWRSTSCKEAPE